MASDVRVGDFVCHCGKNIAATVNVEEVTPPEIEIIIEVG